MRRPLSCGRPRLFWQHTVSMDVAHCGLPDPAPSSRDRLVARPQRLACARSIDTKYGIVRVIDPSLIAESAAGGVDRLAREGRRRFLIFFKHNASSSLSPPRPSSDPSLPGARSERSLSMQTRRFSSPRVSLALYK